MAYRRNERFPLGDDIAKIRNKALDMLARREYSCSELAQKLEDKGADPMAVAQIIGELAEKGYVDDRRYAGAFIRDRREFHPRGAVVLRRELQAKGVDSFIIEEVMEEEYDEQTQSRVVQRLVWREMKGQDIEELWADRKAKEKIFRRLMSKGFPGHMVTAAFDEIRQQGADFEC